MPCKLSSQVRTCLFICDSLLSPTNKSKRGKHLWRKTSPTALGCSVRSRIATGPLVGDHLSQWCEGGASPGTATAPGEQQRCRLHCRVRQGDFNYSARAEEGSACRAKSWAAESPVSPALQLWLLRSWSNSQCHWRNKRPLSPVEGPRPCRSSHGALEPDPARVAARPWDTTWGQAAPACRACTHIMGMQKGLVSHCGVMSCGWQLEESGKTNSFACNLERHPSPTELLANKLTNNITFLAQKPSWLTRLSY